jgi:hypothetical protein
MSDFQIGDLVVAKSGEHKGQIGLYSYQCESVPQYHYFRPIPGQGNLIGSFGLFKIRSLSIEDLRSHDFSQDNLQLWRTSFGGVTELSICYWKLEQSSGMLERGDSSEGSLEFSPTPTTRQKLSLLEGVSTHVFSPNLDGLRQLYLNKDDAIVAFAWMIREQQAELSKQIAALGQKEREVLAGLSL